MKCCYDGTPESCERCPFDDCIRDDITDDPAIKERYAKREYIRERFKTGIKYKTKDPMYQVEYRKTMSDSQKDRYRQRQKEYARMKRAMEKLA